ncbi:MAG: FAD-dependent oxidoreductase [Cocleimonas sp.]|nr:FAD-dependent oxidoreductase [Cocleimonas sp.]
MKNNRKTSNPLTRRDFLLSSLAISLGIPSCYSGGSDNKKTENPTKNVPPSKQSKHVLYYEKQDEAYEAYRHSFNKRIDYSPKIIAVCLGEKGVQEAVKYANYYQLPIAIKSGGHSFEGYCLNTDGMVIELSKMNAMHYSEDTGLLITQPGSKLSTVYKYLDQFNQLIPAGSCGGVSVAGLTLGGGYGFFSRQHGLTCDHLINIKMVDGDGKLHNSADNPELLWACKGGGNGNFGVITELIFKTVSAPKHFTSYRFKFYRLTPKRAEKTAKLWFSLMKTLPRSCYSAFVLNGKTLTLLITDTEEKPSSSLRAIIKQLKVKASKSYPAKKKTFLLAIKAYQGRQDPLFFKNVSAGYYKDFSDIATPFRAIVTRLQQQPGAILQINTLGGEISNKEKIDTAAYPHREFSFLGELQVYYNKKTQGEKAVKTVQHIQQQFLDAGITNHYRNYPDIDLPNWETAYFGTNYDRLMTLKQHYDPNDHIRHPQSIKPS